MAEVFKLYLDDTSPSFLVQAVDSNGNAQDLTAASAVFKMWNAAGTEVVSAAATIVTGNIVVNGQTITVDETDGWVQYDWDAADTATAGLFTAKVVITYADSSIETFPNDDFQLIRISNRGDYEITATDVLDGFSTGASVSDLEAFIAVVDQANTCLTANGVALPLGRHMKVLGVRHLVANASDRGAVTQERAVSGASRTYGERAKGETGYLETLRTIDRYGCVVGVLNYNARVQLRSVGRRSTET